MRVNMGVVRKYELWRCCKCQISYITIKADEFRPSKTKVMLKRLIPFFGAIKKV